MDYIISEATWGNVLFLTCGKIENGVFTGFLSYSNLSGYVSMKPESKKTNKFDKDAKVYTEGTLPQEWKEYWIRILFERNLGR